LVKLRIAASVSSSLKFLRKTPWAREKVEGLYLFMLHEQQRNQGHRVVVNQNKRLISK
jgi:uncharacterized protein (DUF2132 family)